MERTVTIERYLDEYTSIWPFSGVISVMKSGAPFFQKAYGMACHEFGIPNATDTCFALGSISKQFTAFAVMQLYDRGQLDIDAPVNHYLPDHLQIDQRITIHHLLAHTSGLPDFYTFKDDFFQGYDRNNYSQMDFFSRYINRPLRFEPGERFEYCNAGYNMLAWLVESVSGKEFGDYLKEHIFLPLDMQSTMLDDGTRIIRNKAYSYTMDRDAIVRCPYYNDKFSIGAGGIVSDCTDLHTWYRHLRNGGLLSEAAFKRYMSESTREYCYGLGRDMKYGRVRYFHGGDHLGVLSYMQNYFQDDVCVIILANNDFSNQYKLGDAITDIVFTGKAEVPKRLERVELDEAEARRYEGVYLDKKIELCRHNGSWEFVRFDGNLHIAVYPVGNHQFSCKWREQFKPYTLAECEDGVFEFFGFRKKHQCATGTGPLAHDNR